MWQYPELDPIVFSIGPISIHWYAISYLVGIGLAWWVAKVRVRRLGLAFSDEQISDLVFYATLGLLLGGRIGYTLFYGLEAMAADPLRLFRIWEGGMSFHGGLLGVLAAMLLFARKIGRSFFEVTDFIAPVVPLGLGSGRLGNFVNTELPGRMTDVPWAVQFPGELIGRHPSSLYQAALEGPVLFLILWWFANRQPARPTMAISGVFCLGYGSLRVISELFREPDAHLRFVAFDFLTMGQLLSVPLALLGVALLVMARRAQA